MAGVVGDAELENVKQVIKRAIVLGRIGAPIQGARRGAKGIRRTIEEVETEACPSSGSEP